VTRGNVLRYLRTYIRHVKCSNVPTLYQGSGSVATPYTLVSEIPIYCVQYNSSTRFSIKQNSHLWCLKLISLLTCSSLSRLSNRCAISIWVK